jgi:UDPglucose 6-dehydrogenase
MIAARPKVGIIGLGHIGLPTALGFAELGFQVVGADDDAAKARQIAQGRMPFFEPGLDALLRRYLAERRFTVADTVQDAMRSAEVLFVCVGTPQRDDGSADMSQIEAVARAIARSLNGYKLVVEKSTSPVRTAEQIKRTIRRYANGGDHPFDVAVNPEFLREGSAWTDLLHPDRIVLGVESERARALLLELYRPLIERLPADRVIVTDLNTAELIKHASNAFLATKISFINLMAEFCEASGADVALVARGMGLDPRIGPAFLRAGAGFGGYCLPKDLRALIRMGEERAIDVALLRAVEEINRRRVDRIVAKVEQALWVLRGKTVGILGVAFKPGTDDVREAPALRVMQRLLGEGVRLRVHDPQATDGARQALPEDGERVIYAASPYDAARGAHALVVLTEWPEYGDLDLTRLAALMETAVMVDARNLYDPAAARAAGFDYTSVGRP